MKRYTLYALALLTSQAALASDLNVYISDITNTRSTQSFRNGLEIELKLSGDILSNKNTIVGVELEKATDNRRKNLIKPDLHAVKPDYKLDLDDFGKQWHKHSIKLATPNSNSNQVNIKGSAIVYEPSIDNGSIAVINNFISKPGVPLPSKALKKAAISVIYMDKKTLEKMKQDKSADPAERLGEGLGQAFKEIFSSMLSGFGVTNDANAITLLVDDPQNALVGIGFMTADGKRFKHNSRFSSGKSRFQYGFSELPPKDLRLVVYTANDRSIKKRKFKLTDVQLP